MSRSRLLFALSLATLLLALPSVSAAAIRYAAPGGSGAEPCNPTPCSFQKAVNGAKDGDQVMVAGGTYKPTAEVEVDHAIEVGGQPGATLPVVQISENFLTVKNPGAVVHDLRVEVVKETLPYAITVDNGTVERVYAYSMDSAGACDISNGTIRDSVCWGNLNVNGASAEGSAHVVLRNITATTTVMGATANTNATIDGANLIMHSIVPSEANGADLDIDVSAGSSASIVLTHSNYATVFAGSSSGTKVSFTPPGTNGNQTAPPQFVNIATGDVHELATSPTVDAGLADPLIGATDLEGNSRAQSSCIGGAPTPDIGAYELTPTSACPRPSNRFGFGKLKRDRKRGTARLTVTVPGAGELALTGPGVVGQKRALSAAGVAALLIKVKGKRRRKLERTGSLKLGVKVGYTPTGGDPATQTKTVKLVRSVKRSSPS